jgi:hypothetical protein
MSSSIFFPNILIKLFKSDAQLLQSLHKVCTLLLFAGQSLFSKVTTLYTHSRSISLFFSLFYDYYYYIRLLICVYVYILGVYTHISKKGGKGNA